MHRYHVYSTSISRIADILFASMEGVFKLATSKRVLVSGACLFFLLRLAFKRMKNKRKYVTNLDSIGRKVGEGKDLTLPVDAPEYDFVIVGGGTSFNFITSMYVSWDS